MLRPRLRILLAEINHQRAIKDEPVMTLVMLAEETGLAYTTVQRLHDNVAKQASFATLEALMKYFGLPLSELFFEADEVSSGGKVKKLVAASSRRLSA